MSDRMIILLVIALTIIALSVGIPLATSNRYDEMPPGQPTPQAQISQIPKPPPTLPESDVRYVMRNDISGSVWLTRNDGSSNILRGLKLSLMDEKCDVEKFIVTMKTCADFSDKDAENIRKVMGARVDFIVAFTMLQTIETGDRFPIIYDFIERAERTSTTTDVDGHYVFEAIPSGEYLIYARFKSAILDVQWIYPVSGAGKKKIDLHNANVMVLNGTIQRVGHQ